jgi:hypothetical protein
MRKKIALGIIVVMLLFTVTLPVLAGGMNYATAWETLGDARWNGYVQIQACYNDGGRHAKQGYHRFIREAGPALDTGRMYTSQATSPQDCTVRSRQDSVWDSPLWGDKYTTRYYYGFSWW